MAERHLTLQLHPDWPSGSLTVLDAIAADGRYVSQFVTGTSNGGLTAHRGGDRWRWESRLFGGRYDDGPAADRPVYGAVSLGSAYGGSPRFGSAYLRLRAQVCERATFCFPDSVYEPDRVVGPDRLDELVQQCAESSLDELDRYVEAHVHGGVTLADDVEAVVLDPCFRDTSVEAAARRTDCPVEWHRGFRVDRPAELDRAYRGPEYVDLATALVGADPALASARDRALDPAILGAAARAGRHDPTALKRVWHLLARFGRVGGGDPTSGG